jgi:hypothetical protein
MKAPRTARARARTNASMPSAGRSLSRAARTAIWAAARLVQRAEGLPGFARSASTRRAKRRAAALLSGAAGKAGVERPGAAARTAGSERVSEAE